MRPTSNSIFRFSRAAERLLVVVGLTICLSGCLFSPDKGERNDPVAEKYKPQTSVQNVLANLKVAYVERDYIEYEKLFDPDFFFVFSTLDIAENEDIPEEYSYIDDQASTKNMFEDDLVESVELDYVLGTPTLADQADEGNHPFPPGTMEVTVSEVELAVTVRPEDGGENTIFQVAGDQAIFFIYPSATETIDGVPKWYIIEWRDIRIGLRPLVAAL